MKEVFASMPRGGGKFFSLSLLRVSVRVRVRDRVSVRVRVRDRVRF